MRGEGSMTAMYYKNASDEKEEAPLTREYVALTAMTLLEKSGPRYPEDWLSNPEDSQRVNRWID